MAIRRSKGDRGMPLDGATFSLSGHTPAPPHSAAYRLANWPSGQPINKTTPTPATTPATATATSSDGRYAINENTGQITVKAALNFEAALPSKVYTVIARDNAGAVGFNQVQSAVTIGITDVKEANAIPAT